VAVEVCRLVGGELVSVDSRQVFRHMPVATNVPSAEELRGVRSHLTEVLDPDQRIDAARFLAMARPALDEITSRGAVPVLTAGTGLYLKSLLEGLDLGGHPSDPGLRAELEAAAVSDLAGLFSRLEATDPSIAARTDRLNPVRVVRRLELAILRERGLPEALQGHPAIPAQVVGLDCDRAELHRRIAGRVEQMLERGIAEEVSNLLRHHRPSTQVLAGIGIAEMVEHLQGQLPMSAAMARIAQRTRAYARRQLTWFRADAAVNWVDTGQKSVSDIVGSVMELVSH
jgi:tRNA dimethylallyltransferase